MKRENIITKKQMKTKYPDQWLLIKNYKVDKTTSLTEGKIIAHSKDRDEIHQKLNQFKGNLCIHFTGKLPEDTGVLFSVPNKV